MELDEPEFFEEAECRGSTPDIFFEEQYIRMAKKMCSVCKVQQQCLQWALYTKETEGVWGGLTARERQRLRRKH